MPRYSVVECEECFRSFMGTLPDWLTFATTAVAVYIAWRALGTWKEQLEGGSRHATALAVSEAALALWYAFYQARSFIFQNYEFPIERHRRPIGHQLTNDENASDFEHLFRGRRKELWPYVKACLEVQPKAGAVYGPEAAVAVGALVDSIREWAFSVDSYIEQLRAGEDGVKHWTDQDHVKKVKADIVAPKRHDDELSLQFEAAMDRVFRSVGKTYAPPQLPTS